MIEKEVVFERMKMDNMYNPVTEPVNAKALLDPDIGITIVYEDNYLVCLNPKKLPWSEKTWKAVYNYIKRKINSGCINPEDILKYVSKKVGPVNARTPTSDKCAFMNG